MGLLSGFLSRLPLPRVVHFLDMILPQMVPVKSPCRTSARRESSSYLMEKRCRSIHHVAELQCKVCHLHWSRVGVAHVFIDWNQQRVPLLTTRLLADRDLALRTIDSRSKWVFEKETLCSDLYQSVLIMQC